MHALNGKTVIITGASMGIGRALAILLAREQVNLVLNARSEELLRETRTLCRAAGTVAAHVAGDAAESATVGAMVVAAEKLGRFCGFIHAAGVLAPGPCLWELEETAFAAVFRANVTAAYQLVRSCAPLLLKQNQGLAVFFGSGAAEKTQPGIAAYCAAKAAEEHLARQLAVEAPSITTFIYRPGIVETRMQVQARNATGGAAPALHQVFRPWKEKNLLLSAEAAAAGLVQLLASDYRRWHGRTMDIRER